ncbi:hypothetical protein PG997_008141 [Apiospora hydei]|uniref:F-box domain-containing protein n=1 Tax=Apiospora hydei TaxID=1337664 RepID=A0ABR1WA02_9PEZI
MSIQLPELVFLIVDQLHDRGDARLASYASISPIWQHAVERRTFAHLEIFDTDISDFARVFSNYQHRRNYLRQLDVDFHFLEPCILNQQVDENKQIFQSTVTSLLGTLQQWEDQDDRESSQPGTFLTLLFRYHEGVNIYGPRGRQIEPSHDWHVLHLPRLHRVGGFIDCSQPYLYSLPPLVPHPSVVCDMARLFSQLRTLELQSIEMKIPSQEDFTEGQGIDPLCEAIRRLAQPTVKVLMVGRFAISADLFRNRRQHATREENSWKALEKIVLWTHLMDATGRWYLDDEASRNRGLGSFLEDYTDTIFNNMPCMRYARLVIGWEEKRGVDIRCYNFGKHFLKPDRRHLRLAWWGRTKQSLPDRLRANWDDWLEGFDVDEREPGYIEESDESDDTPRDDDEETSSVEEAGLLDAEEDVSGED